MKFLIRDIDKNIISTNFDNESLSCYECESKCMSDNLHVSCIYFQKNMRYGKKEINSGSIFICCSEKTAKKSKLLKEKLEVFTHSLPNLISLCEEVKKTAKKEERDSYAKIVHNIKSINAKNIQAIYSLIPQEKMIEHYKNQILYIRSSLLNNPDSAAMMFFRIMKNNLSMVTEFSAHDKLTLENPFLSINRNEIKKVILNVYHAFAEELRIKNIDFRISDKKQYVYFDYDTIRLALYHLFSNASKYIKPNSRFNVEWGEFDDKINIKFEMKSVLIHSEEIDAILEDNYSGKNVKEHLKGSGLGMGQIKQALKLNNADLVIKPGKKIERHNKVDYADNVFIFSFNKSLRIN